MQQKFSSPCREKNKQTKKQLTGGIQLSLQRKKNTTTHGKESLHIALIASSRIFHKDGYPQPHRNITLGFVG